MFKLVNFDAVAYDWRPDQPNMLCMSRVVLQVYDVIGWQFILIEGYFFGGNMAVIAPFQELWNNYPTGEDYPYDELYDSLGWSDLKNNPLYRNTCAVRMSLCLIKSGVTIPGRFQIKAGPYKGKRIEPGQAKLSNLLTAPNLLGAPQKFKFVDREKFLRDKQGIVSFMRIPTYVVDGALGGHIDLVKHGRYLFFWDTYVCQSSCHWDAQQFWFWPVR